MIKTRQLFDQDTWTYTYLIFEVESKEAVIVDPVLENFLRDTILLKKLGLTLVGILETHVHADHITAANKIRNSLGVKIYMGSKSGVKDADVLLDDGDQIKLGTEWITAIHTPGHTKGSTTYYIDNMLFTGDTLFIGGTGRTDFQNGSSYDAYDSLFNKLLKLPEKTLVYPAHDYNGKKNSTIESEKNNNPRLQVSSKEEYAEIMNNLNLEDPKMMDIAITTNLKGLTLDQV